MEGGLKMTSLLITQCLQNDFVKPLNKTDSLPNLLHVGYQESRRLIGDNPADGPVARFMSWANSQPSEKLAQIHIRDWHDKNDSVQAGHLRQFGQHCLAGTSGAEFVFSVSDNAHTIIDSTTLNDFEGTLLAQTLNPFSTQRRRVGLIGVWTEAKILFLAYELATRYPDFEIAVCSGLCASSSRSSHFLALQQLQRIVGVRIIDSVGAFIDFMGGDSSEEILADFQSSLQIEGMENLSATEADVNLLRYLFRDCKRVSVKILDGGFSGNIVVGTNSIDRYGHEQASHVVKIGPRDLMAKERTAFEQIETVLGNNAPSVADFADWSDRGAIKYRYASMGTGKAKSFQNHYQGGADQESISRYLHTVLNDQLGRLYRAVAEEKQDLLTYYCFDSRWAESVRQKIIDLIGHCSADAKLTILPSRTVDNIYTFYKHDLAQMRSWTMEFPFSFVHGDLNGANIIIDERDNVWLIDFFHTHRGHVLKDFAKLENDVLYIYTKIDSESELAAAASLTDVLLEYDDPFNLPPDVPAPFLSTRFERAYTTLRQIRSVADIYIMPDTQERRLQWLLPQLRYAVHTLGFDESGELQRRWALYAAGRFVEEIRKGFLKLRATSPFSL